MKSAKTRALINAYLKKEERSIRWLALKAGVNYNTLYFVMVNEEAGFSFKVLAKLNQFLGTKYTNDK